jgi:hypothetical protein
MKKLIWLAAAGLMALTVTPAVADAQTITSPTPGSTTIVKPWKEYATHELRDAWDMNKRTDIGFFTWGVDQPGSNMTGKKITTDTYGNSVFQGTPATNDPSFFLLDPFFTSGSQLGKVGANYPIDTSQYTRLLIKMRVANEIKPASFGAIGGQPVMQVFWSRDSIFSLESDPVNGRLRGGAISTVTSANDPAGFPLSPSPAGCQGASSPCGAMEGGRYVVHDIPLADLSALSAMNTLVSKWFIYNQSTQAHVANWGAAGVTADSFRIDPVQIPGSASGAIEVDWVRLVAPGADAAQTLSWSGGGTYDIVMSTQSDCGAGGANPGNYAVIGYTKSSGFQFYPQSWPNGTYYVGLRDKLTADGADSAGSRTIRACSTGKYVVRDYPEMVFTSPNPLGSDDDFATVHLNNPWDFATASDIDFSRNITSSAITSIPAERPDGTSMGNVTVFFGVGARGTDATGGVGDPHSYLIRSDIRGLHKRIDTTRYRLFTTDIGINRERDINLGSHLRLVWHIAGETWNVPATDTSPSVVADAEHVSNDLVVRHMKFDATRNQDQYSTRYTLDRIQADMADRVKFPLETDPGIGTSPSRTGWFNNAVQCANPGGCSTARIAPFDRVGVDNFRIDYVEFADPTEFYVTNVRLAAHEKTTGSFNITWTSTMPAVNPGSESASDWRVALFAVPIRPESSPGAGNASPMTPASTNCSTGGTPLSSGATHPTLASGSFIWNTPTAGLTGGALYFVCAGLIIPGESTPSVYNFSQWPVIYDPSASATMAPRLFLDRTELKMAAKHTGANNPPNLSSKTPAQTVNVTQVGGTSAVSWTVDVCQDYDPNAPPTCSGTLDYLDYIQLSATSGSGTGSFTVQLKDSSTLPQTTGSSTLGAVLRVRETFPGSTANSVQYIQLKITIIGPTATGIAPVGQVDTPAQNATGLQGAIGVTGWAVDDIGLASVKIYRNCLAFEPQASCEVRLGVNTVEIGTAAFVPGARPDVESAFSTYPQSNQAGWGYLLLTNMLPHIPNQTGYGGQGSLTLYVIATDIEGRQTLLGRAQTNSTPTAITMNNDAIAKPFGAIDTPSQGGTTSGSFANFGWALTPDTNTTGGEGSDILIPTNGSTMTVFIDGVPTALVGYNQCRGNVGNPPSGSTFCNDDVSNIFGNTTPQPSLQTRIANPTKFRNLDAGRGAIGAYVINTTGLSNGLHSIAWSVSDSAGRNEGIGSRNFVVVNGVSDAFSADPELVVRMNPVGPDLGMSVRTLDPLERLNPLVPARVGWDLNTGLVPAAVREGTARVTAREFERVEVALPRPMSGYMWDGYLVQHGRLMPLPPGSLLDAVAGRFTWQTVPGYLGDYELVFVRRLEGGRREVLPVTISFIPRTGTPGAQQ